MKTSPKSPALLEAQTGKYLLSPHVPDRMSYIGMGKAVEFAMGLDVNNPYHVARLHEINPYAKSEDFSGLPKRYKSFLRAQSAEERRETMQTAEYISRYDQFRTTITSRLGKMVGKGDSSHAYLIEFDGSPYVVRKVHTSARLAEIDNHLRAAVRVQDIPHLEHIVAASYRQGETVAPHIAGRDVWQLNQDEVEAITQRQFDEFYASLEQAYERNVGFDGYGDNIIYDTETGFTGVDLALCDIAHRDPLNALYDKFTDQAELATIDMAGDSYSRSKINVTMKLCRMLADTVEAKNEPDHLPLVKRLRERADDLAARLRARE